jgi:carboxypeptidase family protein
MRTRGKIVRALRLPAFFILAIAAWAASTTRLSVNVKTQSGKPVERASIIVKCLDRSVVKLGKLDCPAYELKTNQEGQAKLPPIPQGKIRIQVIAKGYQTFGQDFTIKEDEKTVDIKLNPPQQQYSAHQ